MWTWSTLTSPPILHLLNMTSHVYITINLFNLCQQSFLPFYIYFLKCWHRLNEPRYVVFVVIIIRSFLHLWLVTGFVTKVTKQMSIVEQELLTLPEHLSFTCFSRVLCCDAYFDFRVKTMSCSSLLPFVL